MVLCSDETLYTGISTDVTRRLAEHSGARGAKYFLARDPRRLVYVESGHTRSSACRREIAIKRLCRSEKDRLIRSRMNEISIWRRYGPGDRLQPE